MSTTKLVIATSAILIMAAALAANDEPREGADVTSASIAALKSNLGDVDGLEIDEVRVTGAGVACINYRVGNSESGESRGHAVVQRNEVLKSSADDAGFEKAWSEHCLGPRGGMTGGE